MADASREQQSDARVFDEILSGQMSADTALPADDRDSVDSVNSADPLGSVGSADSVDSAVSLADHPHYLKLLELIQAGSSIQRLRETDTDGSAPAWRQRLEDVALESMLFRLHRKRATGTLRLESLTATKAIAIVAGRPVAIGSDQEHEFLGAYLQRAGLLDAASTSSAASRMATTRRTLGSVLLELGLASVDELLAAQVRQCREVLIELFEWPTGEASFYPTQNDQDAASWRDVLGVNALEAVRAGLAPAQQLSTTQLRPLLAPLFKNDESLELACPIDEVGNSIGAGERSILEKVKQGASANAIIAELEEGGGTSVAQGLRALYLFTRTGIITRPNGEMIALACLPPSAIPRSKGGGRGPRPTETEISLEADDARHRGDPLADYRHMQQLLLAGKRLLDSYRATEAAEKLGQAVALGGSRPSTQTLAYYAIALSLSGNPTRGREVALQALGQDKHDALAHAALTRAYKLLGARDKADAHGQRALMLAEANPHYLREVKAALRLSPNESTREQSHPRLAIDSGDVAPWVALAATLAGLFILSNVFRLGVNEYFYNGTDVFFYVRRLWLLAVGLGGLAVMHRTSPIAALRKIGWNITPTVAVVAIGWGVLVGFLSPVQRVSASLPLVTLLTLLHVVSEEIFFRGYITSALTRTWGDMRLTVTVSGALFGLYHLTYYSFWFETDLWPRLNWIALIILVAGIPYAALFHRSKSLLAPLLCHGAVNLAMMWHSVMR